MKENRATNYLLLYFVFFIDILIFIA